MFFIIKKDLSSLENLLHETVTSPVDLITDIGNHLISSGGKRIRPALYLLATKSNPNLDKDYVMPLAMALEMIHTASLVHDDVLDNAAKKSMFCGYELNQLINESNAITMIEIPD